MSSETMSFNPSWMQAASNKPQRPNGVHRPSQEDDSGEMVEPVFAKCRYGREDLIALNGKDTKPPDGLSECPFFVDQALTPMILTELSEAEQAVIKTTTGPRIIAGRPWEAQVKAAANLTPLEIITQRMVKRNNPGKPPGVNSAEGIINHPEVMTVQMTKLKHGQRIWLRAGRTANGKGKVIQLVVYLCFSEDKQDEPKNETPVRPFGRGVNSWGGKADSVWGAEVNQVAETVSDLTVQDVNISNPSPQQYTQPEPSPPESQQWYYLDPNNVQRGPFDTQEMQAWFINGYFHAELRLMKPGDSGYTPLSKLHSLHVDVFPGELLKTNGALTPFVEKKPSKPLTPQPAQAAWQTAVPQVDTRSELSMEQLKALEEKERLLAEEQRRLREKEESLKREEQERLERERKIMELERELQRKQEEMERQAMEKEKELERRRMQVLEYEQKRREEFLKFEEEQRLKLAQEEREKRKAAEMEFARQEQERQRSLLEQEARRKAEEERKFVEEQRRQAEENAKRQREQELIREHTEKLRKQQDEEVQRQQQQRAAQLAAQATPPKAPWLSAKKPVAVKQEVTHQKSLLEIQLEEEKQLLKKMEEQAKEQKRAQPETHAKKAWSNTQTSAWSVPKNVPQPVPIPPAKEPVKQAKTEKKAPKVNKAKEDIPSDPLTAWVIQRVRQLNPSVEPDIFATFLLGIESPNEVEDYVLTYFGENKSAKEFHQEFLSKRIELRPRRRATDKDDLSGPAAAASNVAGNGATVPGSTAANAKGKKNKKGKKVVDGFVLGFRPGADPNRLNVGEIDNTPPVPTRR